MTVMGAWYKGRADFEQRMVQTHRGPFRTSNRHTIEVSVKFLTLNIAVVQARWQREPWEGIIKMGPNGQSSPRTTSMWPEARPKFWLVIQRPSCAKFLQTV